MLFLFFVHTNMITCLNKFKRGICAKYSIAYEKAVLERHLARLKLVEYRHFEEYNWKKHLDEEYRNLYSAWSKCHKFEYFMI